MKKPRFSENQIAAILNKAPLGGLLSVVCFFVRAFISQFW